MTNILQGDALEILKTLKSGSINCCVTSPPYYGLRDYGVNGQIGLEQNHQEYIDRPVDVFREVKRVLRDDGTLWVNIGDSYAGSGKGAARYPENAQKYLQRTNKGSVGQSAICSVNVIGGGIKAKDLIGIPWMLAFALRSDGWYLRQDIIWAKPNPMPESVRDRCTKSHEYIFVLSKSPHYYFDDEAIAEPVADSTISILQQDTENQKGSDCVPGKTNVNMKACPPRYCGKKYTETPDKFYRTKSGNAYAFRPYRKKRDVWFVSTQPYKEAHFATFPKKLIEPCILAGCPKGGTVLDPFCGSGTTGIVSEINGRNYIGIDLNPDYVKLAQERIFKETQQIQMDL